MTRALRTSDGSLTLFSEQFNETYHSIHGAETESRHIFLEASGVADRLRSGRATQVLEIGFGLGLNCLLTADMAAQYHTSLTFTSVENNLLPTERLRTLKYRKILKNPGMAELLVSGLAEHSLNISEQDSNEPLHVQLEKDISCILLLADVGQIRFPTAKYHAIYHDAFSPAANPDCWSTDVLAKLYASLRPYGILSTYTAKGDVRRKLQQIGFAVQKRPGPPGKREFIIAQASPDYS